VLETIALTAGRVPRVVLRDTDGAAEAPLHKPNGGADPSAGTRYRIDGEIARGGMGSVLKGRDPDLGRDVALKVLREEFRGNVDMVRRFVEEAQIGGQLQHPGIVPIYEMGVFGDRRPYFAMKLVKGDTLAKLLDGRAEPSEGLPRFLGIFESIAQTVAYSHARGVIHRDLKPSNVMVGSFGEVQVMDWGLAKVLPRGGVVDDATAGKVADDATVIATARSGAEDSDFSRAGSILGTPSYMSPEQARGELDRVDERADVFALGSILCEILTLQPAFVGRSSGEIQRTAALGDLADAIARLDNCGADADLIAMAKHCLAREPEDRPRAAGAVSARVTSYLTGVQEKLRRAELESVEERARRRMTTVAATALIMLGTAVSGGYVWNQQQKSERMARTTRAVDEALADASRLRGEAQSAPAGATGPWNDALSAAKRAEGLLSQGEADPGLRTRVTTLLTQLVGERVAAVDKANRLVADRALLAELELIRANRADYVDVKQTDSEYSAAFRKAGIDLDKTGTVESGKWLSARSESLELAGYLDDWAYTRRAVGRDEADWRRLVAAARAADPDPWRDALRAKAGARDSLAVAEFVRLADDEKSLAAQPAPSLVLLAIQLKVSAGDRERAARVLRHAVARYPSDFWAQRALGMVHGSDVGFVEKVFPRPEESVRYLGAAVAIRPNSPMAHITLGFALQAKKDFDQALLEMHEALRLKPSELWIHYCLGNILKDQGKKPEALVEYREAIRLMPDNPVAFYCLGNALLDEGRLEESFAAFRESIRLAPDDPIPHHGLGLAHRKKGESEAAIAAFREAVRLDGKQLGAAIVDLGLILSELGRFDEAEATYREMIRLGSREAWVYHNLGDAINAQGKLDAALVAYREGIRLDPGVAFLHYALAKALKVQGKMDEAFAEFREAIRLKPGDPVAHWLFGLALRDQGNRNAAITELREAARLEPGNDLIKYDLQSLEGTHANRDEDAIDILRNEIQLKPDDARAHYRLGLAWKSRDKPDDALLEFREAVRLKPDDYEMTASLAATLADRGAWGEVVPLLEQAVERSPDEPTWRHRLAVALIRSGDRAGYHRTTVSMIERFARSQEKLIAEVARACFIDPDPKDDLAIPRLLAEFAAKRDPQASWMRYVRGLGFYRIGQYQQATESLDHSGKANPDWSAFQLNWPVLAMAHHRLGHEREAKVWLEMARKVRGDRPLGLAPTSIPHWHDREEFLILLGQAELLIDGRSSDPASCFSAFLRGEHQPRDAAEIARFAYAAYDAEMYARSARLFASAFAADPKLAEVSGADNRTNAARSAALAAAGQGKDAPPTTSDERTSLRLQALEWLRAQHTQLAAMVKSGSNAERSTVSRDLLSWKAQPTLASVREPDSLAKLPEAEGLAWRKFWADVDVLSKQAEQKSR
jgi:serine/threonine-protein kinase